MKRLKSWQKNLIFATVVLAAAALLFVLYRANAPKADPLVAVVDFGDGITETIPLDEDHDYLYDVGDYIVHLQVKDGAIAFLDSQCPDHVCEQFGWLSEQDAWAACVPAGVYVTVQAAETEQNKEAAVQDHLLHGGLLYRGKCYFTYLPSQIFLQQALMGNQQQSRQISASISGVALASISRMRAW